MNELLVRRIEEQMRRVSALSTEHIARRLGSHFPMWIGCGYPKSGTVWLCKLLASYFGLPYPQNYAMPIAMSAVVHAHWRYHPSLPKTAYIQRDGRDVIVSLYYYNMKALMDGRHPSHSAYLEKRYRRYFGLSFDPLDVRSNLPKFIESENESPTGLRATWSEHVRDWRHGPRPQVSYVTYEEMVERPIVSLSRLVEDLTGRPADPALVHLAVDRCDFARNSGRPAGDADPLSFLRKGVSGDWQNHFTRDAGEAYDAWAGDVLLEVGYIATRQWYDSLPST